MCLTCPLGRGTVKINSYFMILCVALCNTIKYYTNFPQEWQFYIVSEHYIWYQDKYPPDKFPPDKYPRTNTPRTYTRWTITPVPNTPVPNTPGIYTHQNYQKRNIGNKMIHIGKFKCIY